MVEGRSDDDGRWTSEALGLSVVDDYEEPYSIGTCQGCGAYGELGRFHSRHGEECGEFL